MATDYYFIEDLLTDEHKLIRDSVRNFVKKVKHLNADATKLVLIQAA